MVQMSKLAAQQARMAPVIAELRQAQSSYVEKLMAKTDKAMEDRSFWTNASAFTSLSSIGGGVLKVVANFLPANLGKVSQTAGDIIPAFGEVARSFMRTPEQKAASREMLLMQVQLPAGNDGKRSKGELQKEILDNYKNGMEIAHRANTKALEQH